MRILVTGANGWIGSAAVTALLAAGHDVVGMARSDSGLAAVAALGAHARQGDLHDPEGLRAAAADVDGVVHLAYHHDFSQMDVAAQLDRAAIAALGDGLAGRGGPLLIAAGTLGLARGRAGTEADPPTPPPTPGSATPPWLSNSPTAGSGRSSSGSRRPCTGRATTASWRPSWASRGRRA